MVPSSPPSSAAVSPLSSWTENRLLARLSPEARRRLEPVSQAVDLPAPGGLPTTGTDEEPVYFPLRGMFSTVVPLAGNRPVGVAVVGNEGLVGLPVLLGTGSLPLSVVCQVPIRAIRLPGEALRAEMVREQAWAACLRRYLQVFLVQVAQFSACHRVHSVLQRSSRSLLMIQDRVDSADFTVTQLTLAEMLGTRRASVNAAARTFQRRGLIRYRRGRVSVLDRPGLERLACPCYRLVQEETARLLG